MTITHLDHHRRRDITAFVLGGGGNLGSIQVGMLQAVADHGIVPDIVLGCSVGSLNGLAAASDPTPAGMKHLRDVWVSLGADDVFPSGRMSGPWQLITRGSSLYGNEGIRSIIHQCAPYDRFEEFPIPFQCVATDFATGRARWFDSGPIHDPILASTALPAALPPVEIDGRTYIDGAVVDNVPISRAVALGATRIVVFHVGNFDRPRPRPRRPIDVLLQSFSISRNHRFLLDVDRVPADIDLVVIPGLDPGNVKRNDFSRTAELIQRAHAATAAFLDLRAAGRATG